MTISNVIQFAKILFPNFPDNFLTLCAATLLIMKLYQFLFIVYIEKYFRQLFLP